MANQKNKLFEEFSPVSTEKWKEVISKDLKGADYEKKLVWKTLEGFKVQPYYREADLEGKEYLATLPGEFPYARGNNAKSNDWEIRQDIDVQDVKKANEDALFMLDRGITSLGFGVNAQNGNCVINAVEDLEILFKDIHIECIGIYFKSGHNSPELVKLLIEYVKKKGLDKTKIIGGACYDPLGYLTVKGAWGNSEEEDFKTLKELIELAAVELPNFRVLSVNGQHFNGAGSSTVQELGFSLSVAAEYLTRLSELGVNPETIAKSIALNFGVGTNYFMEIAKIRAARYLFAKLLESYGSAYTKISVCSFTSGWNATIYDPYANVLRATTESMAAVIGGTDTLVVKPFDQHFKPGNKFSERIARNIQIILKEESYFDKIVDPSAGSYYIENLTDSIIEESWKLFLDMDSKSGYLTALKEEVVQNALEETANQRNHNLASRREILLGTNQFPNYSETAKDNIDVKIISAQVIGKEGNEVKTIKKYRGSYAFDELRLATESHSKRPKVFMLTLGNLAFRKARATFSCNFFACAGYEPIDNLGFKSPEEGVEAALKAEADIVVVCSSDDEYAEFVPKVNTLIDDKAIVVVAGAPKCMDELKAAGIEHFINVRSNVLTTLQEFNKLLGIN